MMSAPDTVAPAAERLHNLLGYVEQVVRLDERPALRLSEHRLPTGQSFVLHQHELHAMPGVRHDLVDEDGPVWLAVERLRRTDPPAPPELAADWLEISPDPEREPKLRDYLLRTVTETERDELLASGAVRPEDVAEAIKKDETIPRWDVRLRLEDRSNVKIAAETWITEQWLPWSIAELPVRRSLALYQRLFEVTQLAELGGGDKSFELVWGMGLSRWLRDGNEVDLPLVERLVEIEIDDLSGGEIKVRPRAATASVNIRPFEDLGVEGAPLALDASRRAIALIDADEGVSPYRRDGFEPILRACQARLDAEGVYLPDRQALAPDQPVPPAGEHLTVSDRWVLFARRRSDSFILADLENLRKSVEKAAEEGSLPGPAQTLVMGPSTAQPNDIWAPLGNRVGETIGGTAEAAPQTEATDLFFPKPFNDDQIEIVRRLEGTDGIVVQGPPGTGKTHTISNIICHYMATGRRVLVVSHGEPALAVLRNQLPEGVRDLAISITATEREGFKQLETAVRLLQSVVESIKPSEQSRLIRDLEASVVGLRTRLEEVDKEIERFALLQLAPTAAGERPAELAKRIVSSAEQYRWFEDRPEQSSQDVGLSDDEISALRAARVTLSSRLEHLDAVLPSVEDLPDGEVIARLHEDLVRSERFAEAAARHGSLSIRIGSAGAIGQALRGAEALETLQRVQTLTKANPWLEPVAQHAIAGERGAGALDLLLRFAEDAKPIVEERKRYLAQPVELPDTFEPAAAEATPLIGRLANGEDVFGFFAFREKALRPVVQAIKVQGRTPAAREDWDHIRQYLIWREQVTSLSVRWRALAEEIGAPSAGSAREIEQLVGLLGAILVEGAGAMRALEEVFGQVVPGASSPRDLWRDPAQMEHAEEALRNAAASAQLAAARVEVSRLEGLFSDASGKIGKLARDLLGEAIGRSDIETENVARLWGVLRRQINDLNQHKNHLTLVRTVTGRIREAGAPLWSRRLAAEPVEGETDALIPAEWREAWDWAAASAYLARIDDRDRLRILAEERVRLDAEIRKTFERVVRERTFYELGRSMSGPVRSALMMFATALRKTGKGTGKGAVRHRRDARSAMAQCYDAIPCWIMPTWRVAEQLPGEVGSFDLVIMDEASQSDIREVPALLRGKKILVVGDDKQVSPTAAFIENAKIDRLEHGFLKGQPFKTLLLPGASLYDLAKVMFPDKLVMLKEHFRCVEPIIRFSMQFYPEPLVPLRVPTAHERLDPPLVDIYVPDGRRQGDKQNPREAEVIVSEIRKIVEDPALAHIEAQDRWRTIGVVSLIGAKQAALINRMLLDALGEDMMMRHRIACGDSATFQGNERDIVFLSMIADPKSKQAQTAAQFEQRFNVALSRARDRLVLVRSVREEELKPDDLKARVIRHFRDPMAGAATPTGDLEAMCESDFEREVLRRLLERGYRVTPQVGAMGYRIDLVVEGANGRRLAVECDGDQYHGPERWADDMRRQRILERVGWRFWRCWASSFTLDPDGCMGDLFATLERHGIEPSEGAAGGGVFTAHITAPETYAKGDTFKSSETEQRTQPHSQTQDEIYVKSVEGFADSANGIRVGDRVIIRYLDDNKTATFILSATRDDLTNGFLAVNSPLGKELVGLTEEDETEFEVKGRMRRVLIVRTDRSVATH
jgi:very-short-patch-repair endonuclease